MKHLHIAGIATITIFLSISLFASETIKSSKSLEKATISELLGDVGLKKGSIKAAEQKATLHDIIKGKDFLRTGKKSRAELEFADDSFTRLGSNTVFSFDPEARSLVLSQGRAVAHTPPGKGGLIIRTAAATAAIQGDTIFASSLVETKKVSSRKTLSEDEVGKAGKRNIERFVALSPRGGPTNGNINVTLANGEIFPLKGGQMATIQDGKISIIEINIKEFIKSTPFLQGIEKHSSAKREMEMVETKQQEELASGNIETEGETLGALITADPILRDPIPKDWISNRDAIGPDVITTKPTPPAPLLPSSGSGSSSSSSSYFSGCWVAEELYGKENEKTHRIRAFCVKHLNDNTGLGEFCRSYRENGKTWAEEIRHNKIFRSTAKAMWDLLDGLAKQETFAKLSH